MTAENLAPRNCRSENVARTIRGLQPFEVIELRNIAHALSSYKVGGDRELGRFNKGLALRIIQALSGFCEVCNGAGEIGCLRHDGYDCEPCPECNEVIA